MGALFIGDQHEAFAPAPLARLRAPDTDPARLEPNGGVFANLNLVEALA